MDKLFGCNLEFVREDDYVEYFLFPQLPTHLKGPTAAAAAAATTTATATSNDGTSVEEQQRDELRQHLNAVQQECMAIVKRLCDERSYIWHKDEFQLIARIDDAQERLLNEEANSVTRLPPHLHGVTHYGDNIADEWFVVYVLTQLTREISGCIARVIDADGEFLLIEAADVLPQWANPETCEQRVYIANGQMQLVQNSPTNNASKTPMSVAVALAKIQQNPTLYRVSKEIQQCINERLQEFNASTNAALHRQIVNLPLGVAALLQQRPALIASAVRAFCERDSIDLKACRSMRYFPPEQRVRTMVCFTRCLYAMLMHSQYTPDRKIGWHLSGAPNSEQYKEDMLGVKIASGFEILATQAKSSSSSSNTNGDDGESDVNDPAWRAYERSLHGKGYFRGNLVGSVEHTRLLKEAKAYFQRNNERFRTAPLVGRDILQLLNSIEINAEQLRRDNENNLQPSDSDDWLNISSDQLDAMLTERYGPKKLYKSNGDLNAEEFTKNLAEFLEKQSAFDGIDVDSDDTEDVTTNNATATTKTTATTSHRAHSVDSRKKVKKNQSMRRACKEKPLVSEHTDAADDDNNGENASTHVRNFLDFVIPEDNWDSNSDMSDYEDEDDLERNFEAMTMNNVKSRIDADIRAYMAQMDRELAQTTIGQSFETKAGQSRSASATGGRGSAGAGDDDFDDIEAFEPININVNTLKNMMDSYKSQLGGSGPVSNLLSAMGVGMSAAAGVNDEAKAKDLSESAV